MGSQNYLSIDYDIIPAKGLQWYKENLKILEMKERCGEERGVQLSTTNRYERKSKEKAIARLNYQSHNDLKKIKTESDPKLLSTVN